MKCDYREFLRMLRREPGRPVLFEPEPAHGSVAQIIWRAGALLWDTPEHRVATLASFFQNIKSDTLSISADKDNIDAILGCGDTLPTGLKFTVISNDENVLTKADTSEHVCAVASMLKLSGDSFEKPLIFMARSDRRSEVDGAVERGAAGVYVPCDAEFLWQRYNDKIAILGGLCDSLIAGSPVRVHERVKSIHAMTEGKGYAFGTGLIRTEPDYLAFISLLGMFNTLCENYK